MPIIHYDQNLKQRAQQLRREMTEQEKRLWYGFLRGLPIQIRRQKQFGHYIADFYCSSAKLIIEIDGSQHYWDEGIRKDSVRDSYFMSIGIRVVRISNHDVDENFEDVCAYLAHEMGIPYGNELQ